MMFLEHFKMTQHPFAQNPSPEQILKDDRINQGLARLEYFLSDGCLALLLGLTGVGKSLLLRCFIDSLSPHRYLPLYLHLTHVKAAGLLRLIVSALGETPRLSKDRLFMQILDKTQATERATLLILDEAHLLTPEALTDLRLLISSQFDDPHSIKLLLSGQDTLRNALSSVSLADLAQRITVRYHLRPFTQNETSAYIDFRLRRAGASDKLIQTEAKQLIHQYAGGVPRQVNNIATASLINAAARNMQTLSQSLVNDTIAEFQIP